MSYELESKKAGRKPVSIVEFDLDACSLSYGVAPCTATGAAADSCYNTFSTCQDTQNFTKTTKTYRFMTADANIPIGENIIPCVKSVSFAPTRIQFGKGLGYRSSCTVTLHDFKHHDRGVDPYVSSRTYDVTQGTFFGKLKARNTYYNGRTMRIRTGYMNNEYDTSNFETREYIIEKVEGPDAKGVIKITGKDILKKIENDRVKVPAVSEGGLSADLTDSATTFTLTPAGVGSDYPATNGILKIGDEIVTYTTRTNDTLSGVERGQYKSNADKHSAGDVAQVCKFYDNENVVDIIYDILVNYASIDTSYIPYSNNPSDPDEWDDEKEFWLASKHFTTLIPVPTGAQTLIEELNEQGLLVIWWDEAQQKIKLKAIAPPPPLQTIREVTDDTVISMDTSKIIAKDDDRNTQIWAYYNPTSWTEIKDENDFRRVHVSADLAKESDNEYGDSRKKVVLSRWFVTDVEARSFANRYLNGTKFTASEIRYRTDAKDTDLNIGDYINITTRIRQSVTGADERYQYCIIEKKWTKPGHELEFLACQSWFTFSRYAYVAEDGTPDYISASDEEKIRYGFISFNENLITNGTFDSDLSGWSNGSSTSSSWVAGGYVDIQRTASGTGPGLTYTTTQFPKYYKLRIYIDIVSAPASGDVVISFYRYQPPTGLIYIDSVSYGSLAGTGIYRSTPDIDYDFYFSIAPDTSGQTARIDNVRVTHINNSVSTGMSNGDEPYLII